MSEAEFVILLLLIGFWIGVLTSWQLRRHFRRRLLDSLNDGRNSP